MFEVIVGVNGSVEFTFIVVLSGSVDVRGYCGVEWVCSGSRLL